MGKRYTKPGPMPRKADASWIDEAIARRFITKEERRERIAGVMRMRGYTSTANLARGMGMLPSVLYRSLDRDHAPTYMILRLAIALGVTLDYLLERNLPEGKEHARV